MLHVSYFCWGGEWEGAHVSLIVLCQDFILFAVLIIRWGENISSRRTKLQRAVYRDSECVQGKWREQENRTAIFQERVEWVNCEWRIFPFLKILRPHKWLVALSVDHWVTNASQFKIQEQIIFYGFQRFKILYSGPHVFQCWWVWLPKIYYYFFLFLNN